MPWIKKEELFEIYSRIQRLESKSYEYALKPDLSEQITRKYKEENWTKAAAEVTFAHKLIQELANTLGYEWTPVKAGWKKAGKRSK